MNHVKIRRFISLAGVLNGYYCTTGIVNSAIKKMKPVIYSNFIQKYILPSNYWRDPHGKRYLKSNSLLCKINKECPSNV